MSLIEELDLECEPGVDSNEIKQILVREIKDLADKNKINLLKLSEVEQEKDNFEQKVLMQQRMIDELKNTLSTMEKHELDDRQKTALESENTDAESRQIMKSLVRANRTETELTEKGNRLNKDTDMNRRQIMEAEKQIQDSKSQLYENTLNLSFIPEDESNVEFVKKEEIMRLEKMIESFSMEVASEKTKNVSLKSQIGRKEEEITQLKEENTVLLVVY